MSFNCLAGWVVLSGVFWGATFKRTPKIFGHWQYSETNIFLNHGPTEFSRIHVGNQLIIPGIHFVRTAAIVRLPF